MLTIQMLSVSDDNTMDVIMVVEHPTMIMMMMMMMKDFSLRGPSCIIYGFGRFRSPLSLL